MNPRFNDFWIWRTIFQVSSQLEKNVNPHNITNYSGKHSLSSLVLNNLLAFFSSLVNIYNGLRQ